ncbi:MAG: O-antigen ligase family protein [Gemmatimonadales bacterium]
MAWRGVGIALLALGLAAAVLGAVAAPLFDLDRFAFPKELALNLTALGLVAMLALRRPLTLGVVEWASLTLAAWSIVSGLFATNHWLALRAAALTTSGAIVFVGVRQLVAGAPALRRGLGWALVAIVAAAVATGLAEALGWESELLAPTRSPGGLLGNRNFLAHLAVLGLPLVGWLAIASRGRTAWLPAALALAGMVGFVLLSRSRAAWLGLAAVGGVGVVLLALGNRKQEVRIARGAWLSLASGAALGLLSLLALPLQLSWKSDTPYRDSLRDVVNYREGSGRGRLIQYRNSLDLVKMDPVFGTGPGNWAVKYPLVTSEGDPSFAVADPMPTNPWPSSDWVALLVERGPLGLLLALGTGLVLAVVALRRLRSADLDERVRAAMALALLAGLSVMGCFDAVLLLAPPTAIAMAGLASTVPETRALTTVASRAGRARWIALAAVLWTTLAAGRSAAQLASVVVAGAGTPRDRLERALKLDGSSYRLEVLLALRAPCPAALDHAERAARLMPYHPAPPTLARRCGRVRSRTAGRDDR